MGTITSYSALTNAMPADQFVIVDDSDHSMSSSGTDKRIKQSALLPFILVNPSGDTTGSQDTTNINAAQTALQNTTAGVGTIFLAPGNFYITAAAGQNAITLQQQVASGNQQGGPINLVGSGWSTIVYVVGNCTGIYAHRISSYGGQFGLGPPMDMPCSHIGPFVLDGTNATGSAVGLNYGDGLGYNIDLMVYNFSGTNMVAVHEYNDVFWTEKGDVKLQLYNNYMPLLLDQRSTTNSHEYMDYNLVLWMEAGQRGVKIDGCNCGGSRFWFKGNVSSLPIGQTRTGCGFGVFHITGDNGAPVNANDWGRIYGGHLAGKIEGNDGNGQGNGVYPPFLLTGPNANNGLINVTGGILHSAGDSIMNGGTVKFNGGIAGDSALSSARQTW